MSAARNIDTSQRPRRKRRSSPEEIFSFEDDTVGGAQILPDSWGTNTTMAFSSPHKYREYIGTSPSPERGRKRKSSGDNVSDSPKKLARTTQDSPLEKDAFTISRKSSRVIKSSPLSLPKRTESKGDAMVIQIWSHLNAAQEEIRALRSERDDLILAKSILSRKVYRNQCKETDQMFGHGTDSDASESSATFDDAVSDWVDPPEGVDYKTIEDVPCVLVRGERLAFNDVVIRCERALGKGGNGSVIAGRVVKQGETRIPEEVAIKVIPKRAGMENVCHEAGCLKILGEAGIVPRFVTVLEAQDKFLLIMERHGMDLWDLCTELDRLKGGLKQHHIRHVAQELSSLLCKLHSLHFIHRDLKPDNILLGKAGTLLLTDLASSGRASAGFEGHVGTPGFAAPEVENQSEKGDHAGLDMWSLGATLLWMAGEELPKRRCTPRDINQAVQRAFPRESDPDAYSFVRKCLYFPKKKRMTAKDASEHPWLQDIPQSEGYWSRIIGSVKKEPAWAAGVEDYHVTLGNGRCRELLLN